MTTSSDHIAALIREQLNRLPLTNAQKDEVTPKLVEHAIVLDTRGGNVTTGGLRFDSGFFDFAGKVQKVVTQFAADGLEAEDYVHAALKQPTLFYLSPATVAANVAGVVERFAAHGLTRRQYLAAALKHPALFYHSPATVIRNIEGVVERFAAEGLTTRSYLRAARTRPSLFSYSPATIAEHVLGVVQHFAADGLAIRDYIGAALKQPPLFTLSPLKVKQNIAGVVERFAHQGLTTSDYLQAALKQPQLFAQKPETICRHITLIQGMHDRGVFSIPVRTNGAPRSGTRLSPLFAFLLHTPSLLCLEDQNLVLREAYGQLTGTEPRSGIMRQSRTATEQKLMQHLGHDDPRHPVPLNDIDAGLDSPTTEQAKRLLLRALIREGIIKGATIER